MLTSSLARDSGVQRGLQGLRGLGGSGGMAVGLNQRLAVCTPCSATVLLLCYSIIYIEFIGKERCLLPSSAFYPSRECLLHCDDCMQLHNEHSGMPAALDCRAQHVAFQLLLQSIDACITIISALREDRREVSQSNKASARQTRQNGTERTISNRASERWSCGFIGQCWNVVVFDRFFLFVPPTARNQNK